MIKVILYVIYNYGKKAYLSEVNPKDHPMYPNLTTFPGGKVEVNEKLESALLRETKEELGIEIVKFINLGKPLKSANKKYLLHPFLIKEWKGGIPKHILDNKNPLVWENEDKILTSEIMTRPIIVQRAKKYLQE